MLTTNIREILPSQVKREREMILRKKRDEIKGKERYIKISHCD
jgi:hypothetical protein